MTAKPSRSPENPDGPAPRFAVGELVMVRSSIDPARNTDCTRVIDREWFEGEAEWGWYRGWQYVVARHVDAWAVERSLRPRPVPGDESWEALSRRLNRRVVTRTVDEAMPDRVGTPARRPEHARRRDGSPLA